MSKASRRPHQSQVGVLLGISSRFTDLAAKLEAHGQVEELSHARHLLDFAQGCLRVLIEHPNICPQSVATAKVLRLDRILDAGALRDYFNEGVAKTAHLDSVSFEDVLTRVQGSLDGYELSLQGNDIPARRI
jgi:hypothetical protein